MRPNRVRRLAVGPPLPLRALMTVLMIVLVALFMSPLLGGPARAADAAPDRAWPVPGARGLRPLVVRAWDPPPFPWAAGHRGVDLAAAPGTPVRAAAGGTVAFAGAVAGRGVLSVQLAGTGPPPLRTTYEPVRPLVREGAAVRAGEVIGVLEAGARSHCTEGCLHWGLRQGETYLDPLGLLPPWMLRRAPSRLWGFGPVRAPVSPALPRAPWPRPPP
ncbi:M23 family metallopeptidase [Streptomyces sp. NPDC049577]|uniref:murein hydrolase activator EnvC family protein n=1 Tax=Streptomyces sp. NPDC049577 TaxID=3155153 RepID=UPI00344758AF